MIEKLDTAPSANDFTTNRLFDGPRDLVFKAWTERDRLEQWFGPKNCPIFSCTLDLRPGGVFHYGMRMPDGSEMWGKWVFHEIASPKRLVTVTSFADKDGNIVRAPFNADWPLETQAVTTFEEQEGKTLLTLRWRPVNATEAELAVFTSWHASMQQGWAGTFAQLEEFLAQR